MTTAETLTAALEVTVTAPIVSFRNPLYAGVQVALPCPPPATVGGMLAAAAGGWNAVDPGTRFAMAFHARGEGVDLETYHPLEATGKKADPTPRERGFLTDVTLTVWLACDVELWERRLRRPVWPLRLGRSQDLVGLRARRVVLRAGPGRQDGTLLPEEPQGSQRPGSRQEGPSWPKGAPEKPGDLPGRPEQVMLPPAGTLLRLPTTISLDRRRTRWDAYRFDASGKSGAEVAADWTDERGRAVAMLPPTHPGQPALTGG